MNIYNRKIINIKSMNMTKPIIKWIGGKTQILSTLKEKFQNVCSENSLENYYEPFLGGGSVLLALLSWIENGDIKVSKNFKAKAFDINEALIYMFINIRDKPELIYEIIKPMIEYFHSVEEKEKEAYYYQIREYYNSFVDEQKQNYVASAIFIFLNKTGFRGLYREGPKGYNVPYGHYKNPEILNYDHLMKVSSLIKNVEFEVCDFSDGISKVLTEHKSINTFVYLDPPYVPENVKSFTKYNKSDFTLENHKKLFELCQNLPCDFLMSNSDTSLIYESFNENDFVIEKIECKRSINSKNPGAKTLETLIFKK
jgi:DNA adenine methylase